MCVASTLCDHVPRCPLMPSGRRTRSAASPARATSDSYLSSKLGYDQRPRASPQLACAAIAAAACIAPIASGA
eukprot:6200280-Prymnesium_polylepis.1